MTDELYSGNWEGHYSYGTGYSEQRKKVKVGFFIKMVFQDNVLSGTCEEFITKVHMYRPAALSGRIDGNKICFTKQYPYFFEFNEQEGVDVDRSRDAYPIQYTGTFDPVMGIFSGEWEIKHPPDDGKEDEFFSGSWEMWKI